MGNLLAKTGLRDIDYKVFYRPNDNPLQTFYLPTLAAAVHYDRSAGYFRSSALAAAAAGVVRLIANDDRMRLLVGAELSDEDVEAIKEGHCQAHLTPVRLSARYAEASHRNGSEAGGIDCRGVDGRV